MINFFNSLLFSVVESASLNCTPTSVSFCWFLRILSFKLTSPFQAFCIQPFAILAIFFTSSWSMFNHDGEDCLQPPNGDSFLDVSVVLSRLTLYSYPVLWLTVCRWMQIANTAHTKGVCILCRKKKPEHTQPAAIDNVIRSPRCQIMISAYLETVKMLSAIRLQYWWHTRLALLN